MKRLFYLPAVVLTAAFAILCARHGTFWPWNVVVHEDSRHTLIQTIFYFEHALGEWPLDVLLAAAIAGAMLAGAEPAARRPIGGILAGCFTLDMVIFAGAFAEAGPKTALLYLLQFHTRDDVPMAYGSHWRYHLLSQSALMLLPMAFVSRKQRFNGVLVAAWVVFGVLSAIFGISSDSFIDPRNLGHQARELFTHGLVTVPLAVAVVAEGGLGFNLKPAILVAGIGGYLAAGVFLTGAQHHAQTGDWSSVICAHFFEHTFSYLVVPWHALLFYRLGARAA